MDPPETRYVNVDGTAVAYQVFGTGPIDVLLVDRWLHHSEADWDEPWYARSIGRFADHVRCIRFDGRGTGLSDPASVVSDNPEWWLDHWAADARSVLDECGTTSLAIWAEALGAPLGIRIAANERGRLERLVIENGFARLAVAPDHPCGFPPDVLESLLDDVTAGWGHGALLDLYGVSHSEEQRRLEGRYERLAASPAIARAALRALRTVDVRRDLAAIHAPTLVIHRNPVLPEEHARLMAAAILGSECEISEPTAWYWSDAPDPFSSVLPRGLEFITGERNHPGLHRTLATVMFTDVVGSTELLAEVGDAQWRILLELHHAALSKTVQAYGGRVIDTAGDGAFTVFGTPTAALGTAGELRDMLAKRGLDVRIGVHLGEMEQHLDTVSGLNVHVGARISSVADAGEILVSSPVVLALAGTDHRFASRGPTPLKGIAGDWEIFQLLTTPGF